MKQSLDYENVAVWTVGLLLFAVLTAKKVLDVIDDSSRQAFRDSFLPILKTIQQQYGIAPIIPLAQSAVESNWGKSGLTKRANNYFGMTAGQAWNAAMASKDFSKVPKWTAAGTGHEVVYEETREYSELPPEKIRFWNFPGDIILKESDGKSGSKLTVNVAFRKYLNAAESAIDWAKLLTGSTRFTTALAAAKAGDVNAYASAIKASGYATDPNYAATIQTFASAVKALPPTTATV